MKKDQFIIAYLPDLKHSDAVVSYAVWMARALSKGLILLHISDPTYTKVAPEEAEAELKQMASSLSGKGISVTYAALKGSTKAIVTALPQLLAAVAIVVEVDSKASRRSALHKRQILNNFADSRAAFLVVQSPLGEGGVKNAAMSVDFKKESKDKFIWSSYLPRFAGCAMHVLSYDYKDQFLHAKWWANMQQLDKLYGELELRHENHVIGDKSTYMDVNALNYCSENGYDLLIAVTTKEKDGLEFFIGTQEQRTIVNKYRIPILFLNPREDLYVLCD